jgi:hypothetical protein
MAEFEVNSEGVAEPVILGATKEHPIFFKFLRDDENNLDWKKIVLMLALTALSGYLATSSQRLGSHPDQLRTARMRYHRAVGVFAARQGEAWSKIAKYHADMYEVARL